MPVDEAIQFCHQEIDDPQKDRTVESSAYSTLADLLANKGQFTEAREYIAQSRSICIELGRTIMAAAHAQTAGTIEMLAGDPEAAERELHLGYESLNEIGEKGFMSTVAGQLAGALYEMERFDEAEHFTEISREASSPDDLTSQTLWRSVNAKILAMRRDYEGAEKLGREAIAMSKSSDFLILKGDVWMDLGEVLRIAGQTEAAVGAVREALGFYEQKSASVLADKARRTLQLLSR